MEDDKSTFLSEATIEVDTSYLDHVDHFARFFELSVDLFSICNLQGQLLQVNKTYEELLGYTPAEVIGTHVPEYLHPADVEPVIAAFNNMSRGQAVRSHHVRVRKKDGNYRWFSFSCRPIPSEGICYAIGRDIEDLKAVQERITELHSSISHELRTPLASIRGALGLIEGGIVDLSSNDAKDLIQLARASSDRLIRLINDILDLQKIEAGMMHLSIESHSARSLIEKSIAEVLGISEHAGISIKWSADPANVLADCDKTIQILTNLISNSIKFSQPGSKVEVNAVAEEDTVLFSVKDYGIGISKKNFPKLFQKFQQISPSPHEGSGLGLSICKALTEQQKGSIGFKSRYRQGSTFFVRLPASNSQNRRPISVHLIESDP